MNDVVQIRVVESTPPPPDQFKSNAKLLVVNFPIQNKVNQQMVADVCFKKKAIRMKTIQIANYRHCKTDRMF